MKCRCPECGRTTWVPQEQLDFLVRCDRCRTLLLTRSPGETPAADRATVKVVPLIQVANDLRFAPNPVTSIDIADFMTRRQSAGDRAIASAKPPRPRGATGLTTWSVLLGIISLVVAGLIILATRNTPATARAARASFIRPTETRPTSHAMPAAPRPIKIPVVEAEPTSPAPIGDGELFPDIPAKK